MIREANLILGWKVTMQVSAGSCGPDGSNNPYFLLLKNGGSMRDRAESGQM